MAYKATSSYKNTSVTTASPAQIVVMLYDEAVKQLDMALGLLDEYDRNGKKDPGKLGPITKCVIKTQTIITELMASLDMEQGGEIAANLFSLYGWFNKELLEANISHDKRRITIVCNLLSELRTTWNEVFMKAASDGKGQDRGGVNISY